NVLGVVLADRCELRGDIAAYEYRLVRCIARNRARNKEPDGENRGDHGEGDRHDHPPCKAMTNVHLHVSLLRCSGFACRWSRHSTHDSITRYFVPLQTIPRPPGGAADIGQRLTNGCDLWEHARD